MNFTRTAWTTVSGVIVLAALVAAWSLAAPGPADARTDGASWRIEVLEAAAPQGTTVVLGDIARPMGPLPRARWDDLAATPLWAAPEPGRRQSLSRRDLARLLARRLGDVAPLCLLPPHVEIQGGGAVVMGSRLRKLAVDYLTPRMGGLTGEAELRDFRLPRYVFLSAPSDRLEVDLANDLEPGTLSLRFVGVGRDGRRDGLQTGTVFLDLWRTAPCASRPLNKGERLDPDMVTHRRVNAAYLRGDIWDGRDFTLRLSRSVGKDQVLYSKNLESAPTVSRGDKLLLVFEGRHVRLTVDGEAMSDGRAGDMIPVRNLQSRRQVTARIVDSGTAMVR